MTRPTLLLDEVRKLALTPHECSLETILEFRRLGNCARECLLRTSEDSPTAISVQDVQALSVIYPSTPQPLGVVLLPDRDLFIFVAENELTIEGSEGEERLVLILGENDDLRGAASLRAQEGARVVFGGLAADQTYTIGVIALISVDSLFEKAEEICTSGGSKQEALALIDRVLGLNPNLAYVWRRKAYIHRELGQAEPALLAAERSIEVDPNYALGWRCKGALLRDRHEHQLGLDCYLRSLELDPNDHVCWANKGNALSALGREEEAKAAYAEGERVEARYPGHSE